MLTSIEHEFHTIFEDHVFESFDISIPKEEGEKDFGWIIRSIECKMFFNLSQLLENYEISLQNYINRKTQSQLT